ncbi:hypothetical protein OY671_012032, partial [Metschnikowia pulcherrima]
MEAASSMSRLLGFNATKRPDPAIAWPGIYLVARLEVSDIRSDADNSAGHVVSQDDGSAIRKERLKLA